MQKRKPFMSLKTGFFSTLTLKILGPVVLIALGSPSGWSSLDTFRALSHTLRDQRLGWATGEETHPYGEGASLIQEQAQKTLHRLDGTRSVISSTYASPEERIQVLTNLFQTELIASNGLPSTLRSVADAKNEMERKHLKALSVMTMGVKALIHDPSLGLKRKNLYQHLVSQKSTAPQEVQDYLKERTLKTLFPKGFFKEIAPYAYGFVDYAPQKDLHQVMVQKKIIPTCERGFLPFQEQLWAFLTPPELPTIPAIELSPWASYSLEQAHSLFHTYDPTENAALTLSYPEGDSLCLDELSLTLTSQKDGSHHLVFKAPIKDNPDQSHILDSWSVPQEGQHVSRYVVSPTGKVLHYLNFEVTPRTSLITFYLLYSSQSLQVLAPSYGITIGTPPKENTFFATLFSEKNITLVGSHLSLLFGGLCSSTAQLYFEHTCLFGSHTSESRPLSVNVAGRAYSATMTVELDNQCYISTRDALVVCAENIYFNHGTYHSQGHLFTVPAAFDLSRWQLNYTIDQLNTCVHTSSLLDPQKDAAFAQATHFINSLCKPSDYNALGQNLRDIVTSYGLTTHTLYDLIYMLSLEDLFPKGSPLSSKPLKNLWVRGAEMTALKNWVALAHTINVRTEHEVVKFKPQERVGNAIYESQAVYFVPKSRHPKVRFHRMYYGSHDRMNITEDNKDVMPEQLSFLGGPLLEDCCPTYATLYPQLTQGFEAFKRSPWNMHQVNTQVLGPQVIAYLPGEYNPFSCLIYSMNLGGVNWGRGSGAPGGGFAFTPPSTMTVSYSGLPGFTVPGFAPSMPMTTPQAFQRTMRELNAIGAPPLAQFMVTAFSGAHGMQQAYFQERERALRMNCAAVARTLGRPILGAITGTATTLEVKRQMDAHEAKRKTKAPGFDQAEEKDQTLSTPQADPSRSLPGMDRHTTTTTTTTEGYGAYDGEDMRVLENKKPADVFEVGDYNDLKKRSVKDGMEVHHVPQQHPAQQVIPGYDPKRASSIVVPRDQHREIPTLRGEYSGTARDLLAKDIRDLRSHTEVSNEQIKELVGFTKEKYSDSFKK
jgi:hypothetical protein